MASDHLARLPGRAADRLPQSRSRRASARASARTCSPPPSAIWPHRRRRRPRAPAAARRGRDRPQGRRRARQAQDGQALRRSPSPTASFSFARKTEEIAAEAALDGIYVVRTSLPADALDDAAPCAPTRAWPWSSAPSALKTVDLQIRPIYPLAAPRVRAHVFLCMLAYHVEWHMRAGLAPMLYDDDRQGGGRSAARQHRRQGRSAPRPPSPSKPPAAPTTACRCTASKACSPISPRSTRNTVVTALAPDHALHPAPPGQPRSSRRPSTSSASTSPVPSNRPRLRPNIKADQCSCAQSKKEVRPRPRTAPRRRHGRRYPTRG